MTAYPRPKILSEFTVPTGGWDLKFRVSIGGSLNTQLTATVAAGTYFNAWDSSAEDFIHAVSAAINAAIIAGPGGNRRVFMWIDSTNKVNMTFVGGDFDGDPHTYLDDVKLEWTLSDSDLAHALGFDPSADDTKTSEPNPNFQADWIHPYGWYADEDGQFVAMRIEDTPVTFSPHAFSASGHAYGRRIGSRYVNELELDWVPRTLMFSGGQEYTDAPLYPYARNKGLELWWHVAKQGGRFRVYREGRNDTTAMVESLENDLSSSSQIRDSTKSWDTEPQVYSGLVCYVVDRSVTGPVTPARFEISTQTATTLTSVQTTPDTSNWNFTGVSDDTCYILDRRYETYVVDLAEMSRFSPQQRAGLDAFSLSIPLIRYEA